MTDDLARFQNPRQSRLFMRLAAAADRQGGTEHRRRLVAGLSGTVVEIGAGHGPNFAHYPAEVVEVVAVEPDETMRVAAAAAAGRAPVPIRLVPGHADALPLPDASVDAVVFSLVLCLVPAQSRTFAEAVRVLRPGGQVRFYEHVRSAGQSRARCQDAVTPLWSKTFGGCHPNRDTVAAARTAGLTIDELDDFPFGPSAWLRVRHVLARATLPE
jgi:ubiquinone/menaquinone biosynthesis C-methylase UbiE